MFSNFQFRKIDFSEMSISGYFPNRDAVFEFKDSKLSFLHMMGYPLTRDAILVYHSRFSEKFQKKGCFEKISDSLAERPDLLLLWDALVKESHVFPELASIASKNLKSQQESADGFKLFRKHKTWKTFRSDIDAFFDGMYAMERILPIFRK